MDDVSWCLKLSAGILKVWTEQGPILPSQLCPKPTINTCPLAQSSLFDAQRTDGGDSDSEKKLS